MADLQSAAPIRKVKVGTSAGAFFGAVLAALLSRYLHLDLMPEVLAGGGAVIGAGVVGVIAYITPSHARDLLAKVDPADFGPLDDPHDARGQP